MHCVSIRHRNADWNAQTGSPRAASLGSMSLSDCNTEPCINMPPAADQWPFVKGDTARHGRLDTAAGPLAQHSTALQSAHVTVRPQGPCWCC